MTEQIEPTDTRRVNEGRGRKLGAPGHGGLSTRTHALREEVVGLFRQVKHPRKTAEAAPEQGRRMAGAQREPDQQRPSQWQATEADLTPIAGVSLELYVEVSKGLVAYGYGPAKASELAASKGIDPDSWRQASAGWNQRLRANPGVARRFNAIYRRA